MRDHRQTMNLELKCTVVPVLRESGFKGSFPHFRRPTSNGIDLLTFQFDRYGGGFVIEIARCPKEGITTHWGKEIPANKVTAWDVDPNERKRIQPNIGGGTDSWFRYDSDGCKQAAQQVLAKLREAKSWWNTYV
jgi:hypothetical protein